jgi:hypothetical protein
LRQFSFCVQGGDDITHNKGGAGNGGGSRPTVSTDDIAINPQGPGPQGAKINHHAQGAPYKALNLVSSARAAAGGLALTPRMRGTWQHAVFSGYPALL